MKKTWMGFFLAGMFLGGVQAGAAEPVTVVELTKGDADQGLGLSAEQKAKIGAIREAYRVRQLELKRALSAHFEALRQGLDGDKPDRAKVDPVASEIKVLQNQLLDSRIDVVLKLREIYTPAQIVRLKQGLKNDKVAVPRKAGKKVRKLEIKKATVKKK